MAIKIYNTLTRSKEELVPGAPPLVTFYVCGPTVYDYIHIGNARVFIIFDLVRRYLQYRGYKVKLVQNYTDIDDKMINRANEQGISVPELAERFIRAYEEDVSKLRVRPADVKPRATEHIPQIIKLIEKLLDNNYAYVSAGDVYYDTARFADYGKLSHQKQDELLAGARVEPGEKKLCLGARIGGRVEFRQRQHGGEALHRGQAERRLRAEEIGQGFGFGPGPEIGGQPRLHRRQQPDRVEADRADRHHGDFRRRRGGGDIAMRAEQRFRQPFRLRRLRHLLLCEGGGCGEAERQNGGSSPHRARPGG